MRTRCKTAALGRLRAVRDERGVVAVEFALILPLVLFIFLAIVDFGRVFNYLNDTNQIAANGARYAAVDQNPGDGTYSLQEYLALQGDTKELREGGSEAVDAPLDVCIEFPDNDLTGTSGQVGDPVTVKVESEFDLIPLLGGISLPIRGSATMRLERPPSYSADC